MLTSEPHKAQKLHKRLRLSVLLFPYCVFCGSKKFYKKTLKLHGEEFFLRKKT